MCLGKKTILTIMSAVFNDFAGYLFELLRYIRRTALVYLFPHGIWYTRGLLQEQGS